MLPLIGWTIRSVSRRLRTLSKSLQSTMGTLSHVLGKWWRPSRKSAIFGSERYETGNFFTTANAIPPLQHEGGHHGRRQRPIVQTIAVIALAAIIYYASLQSSMNQLTVGGFVSFFGAMALLLSPLKRLSNVNEQLQRGLAAAQSD